MNRKTIRDNSLERRSGDPCNKCGGIPRAKRGTRCNKCLAEWLREYRKTAKGYAAMQSSDIKKLYGIGSYEIYQNLLRSQNNRCALCLRTSEEATSDSSKHFRLCLDHDHNTMSIRGLLCNTCNRALGLLQDDVDILRRAVNYLERA